MNFGIYMIIGTKAYFNSGDYLDTRTGFLGRWAAGDGGYYAKIKGLDIRAWYS